MYQSESYFFTTCASKQVNIYGMDPLERCFSEAIQPPRGMEEVRYLGFKLPQGIIQSHVCFDRIQVEPRKIYE